VQFTENKEYIKKDIKIINKKIKIEYFVKKDQN